MGEERKSIILISLAWVVVFIAACVVAFIAWKTMGNLKIEVFPIGNNIERLGSQITQIEAHYSNLANAQKELLEIWGLAALILGVSGAVASVLRGPQAVIVAFGGFAAVIFGAIKIYEPQLAVQTLNHARSQLVCIKPKVQILTDLSEKTQPLVPSALSSLVESFQPLLEDSTSFMVLVNRLSEIRNAQQEERNVAINAIEQALLQPVADLSYQRRNLRDRIADIRTSRYELKELYDGNPTEELSQMLSRVETVHQQLSDAIDTLMRPEKMEDRLISESKAYREEMARSASRLAAGKKLSNESLALTRELPDKIDRLKIWPTDFENAVAAAHAAVNEIQNQVVSKIAYSGVAKNPVQATVLAATDMLANPQSLTSAVDLIKPAELVEGNVVLSEGVALTDAHLIIKNANKAINKAEQLLLDYRDKLEYANNKIQELDALIINQLPVIVGSVKMLRAAIKKLAEATPSLQSKVDTANQAIGKASEILNRPAPSQLKVQIEACIRGVE